MLKYKLFPDNREKNPKATLDSVPCLRILYSSRMYWIVKSGFKHVDGSPLYVVTEESGEDNGSCLLGEKTGQQLVELFQSDVNPDILQKLKQLA